MTDTKALVSIIIPIYNGEKYICSLIDSINSQNFDNLEVVFVDDGSSDNSNYLLYKLRNTLRFKCTIISQNNMGQGAARNIALENINGDYVVFIDQDDYIASDYIAKLYELMMTSNYDVGISGYRIVTETGRCKRLVKLKDTYWGRFMNITPWGKIYKTDFLRKNKVFFLEVPMGEDVYFNIRVYSLTSKIVSTDYVGYSWLDNAKSYSRTVHKQLKSGVDLFPLLNSLIEMDNSDEWMEKEEFQYFILKTMVYHLIKIRRACDRERYLQYKQELIRWLNTYLPERKNNGLLSFFRPKGENVFVRILVDLSFKYSIGGM